MIMREILFRGKRLDNGNWVTSGSFGRMGDDGINWDYFIGAGKPATHMVNSDGNIVESKTLDECLFYMVDPKTVGQFTGLTDKNGKKIFEGDILSIARQMDGMGTYYVPSLASPVNVEVKWDFCGWMWETLCDDKRYLHFPDAWCHFECEVIGNIHDNQELLEVE